MASGCTLRETTYLSFAAFLLQNEHIEMSIVPELGGKITSIRHVATGREWLWRNPYLPEKTVVYDASYVKTYDTGGIDECFPAVTSGIYPNAPWQGVMVPDHGELWCQPWEVAVVESSVERIVLAMVCHGVRFPYRFERTLTLLADEPTLTLDYQVTNLTPFDMPFVWSIHPILRIEPGMEIRLPQEVETVRVDATVKGAWGERGDLLPWPFELSRVPDRNFGQAVKLYTLPLVGDGWMETAASTPDNHTFIFRFQPQQITHVGLWLNYGGWSGSGSEPYFNLGLEPCIGGTDALPHAQAIDEFGLLLAKQTRHWALQLHIT